MGLEVFDTHTHLIGGKLTARDFWEIGEYFWLASADSPTEIPSSKSAWSSDSERTDGDLPDGYPETSACVLLT